jgi:hypothetical protein
MLVLDYKSRTSGGRWGFAPSSPMGYNIRGDYRLRHRIRRRKALTHEEIRLTALASCAG